MAKRTRFSEYKDRYANFRFELSEEGILFMSRYQRERRRPRAVRPVALLRIPATRRSWMRTSGSPSRVLSRWRSPQRRNPARSAPGSRPSASQMLTNE